MLKMWGLFFYFPFLIYSGEALAARDPLKLQSISQSRAWRLLLHAKPGENRAYESEADGLNFFLAGEKGRINALSELEATLEAFDKNISIKGAAINQNARCAFVARRKFLEEALGEKFPAFCPKYDEWISELSAEKLSVVLAAPYMGSPSSMFGHIFLKIKKKGNSNEYLDWALGFEAVTDPNAGGVGYALKGLAGVFPGVFSLIPYHLKLNQYSNLDSRDLWSFDLPLDGAEIAKLLDHLWELQNTYFDYFFFDENCSYHILSLLEWARPEWKLRDHFYFKSIPLDVLNLLLEEKVISSQAHRRVSILGRIRQGYLELSPQEREDFLKYRKNLEEAPGRLSTRALDLLMEYEKYQKFQISKKVLDTEAQVNFRLLSLRSQRSEEAASFYKSVVDDSYSGIYSNLLELSFFKERNKGMSLRYRPAFHAITEARGSLPPFQSLELFDSKWEWEENQKPRLEEFKFVKIENLSPWDPVGRGWAWNLQLLLNRPWEEKCERCLNLSAEGGLGISWALPAQMVLYEIPSGEIRAGGNYSWNFNFLPFSRTGFLWDGQNWKLRLEHQFVYSLPSHNESSLGGGGQRMKGEVSWALSSFSLRYSARVFWSKSSPDRSRHEVSMGYLF